jgi:DNA-binding MarR family transcriptional regulator
MSILDPQFNSDVDTILGRYLESLSLIERLHRLLLDVIKDEFERLQITDVNAVQALMLYNIGDHEVTAGELRGRGYYQGSNVSYNLKKLVESGLMHHERCDIDRRAVRVRLTPKGKEVRNIIQDLFARQAQDLQDKAIIDTIRLSTISSTLRNMERQWREQIRYIY